MKKQGCFIVVLIIMTQLLCSCVGSLWTAATLIYDRHDVYEKLEDYQLSANVNQALYHDKTFKQPGCYLDLAVFNDDILIAGHLPSDALRDLAEARLQKLSGYRHIYNQVAVSGMPGNSMRDSWITAKIRSQMIADSEIDPKDFKVITSDGIVYVMGDVTPQQAKLVLTIASNTSGVIRVVKLLNYYNLSKKPASA